jgi:predicted RNase H-like nuclease (RuvC/YqgF family)
MVRINKMAYVTIEEAAKLTGKSVQSLYRHVKQGKVSKHHDGFDTAELMRVYGALRNTTDTTVNFDKVSNESEVELSMLKRENELLRGNIEELRTDKHKLQETIDYFQRQLSAPVQATEKSFFSKFFGK